MMKRTVLVFVFLALSLLLLSAGKIELLFWTHEDPNRTEIENRYIEEFESMYPNVTIKRVTYPSRKIQETILTAFAVHKGPDIFNMEINDEYPYIVNQRVAPVDPKAAGYDSLQAIYDDYLAGVLDPVTYNGKLYGLPLELTNWCIFINKKYFREVGLDPEKDYPKTWEEMLEVSEKLVIREGEILKRRGFDFRYPYYLTFLVPMVEQLGGAFLSEDGKTAIINDEAWLKVLEYFQEWGPNGRNLGSPTYTNARKLFNKDNNSVAMCLTGLYQEGRIRADNPDFYNSGEWMVVPFPRFKDAVNDLGSAYYGHYYMVNAESSKEKQEWAWKFIAFMLNHPEEYLTKVGLIQPKKALIESDIFKNIPYADVFLNDMAKSHIITIHERAPMMQDYLKEVIEAVMLTRTSPKVALRVLKMKMQELLEEEW
ncbi:ABC transporter substrate-binding protein [Kosmotoga pacifica]|uniref:ABC transporter substrate-binding protein n=2 Tax=Kosmotoga pacifica TaxID=1330330 RepID=A0A0G2ZAE6_9BACT|nr:ABC transporter substrate-binding protein [Kosmotoga pacifica]